MDPELIKIYLRESMTTEIILNDSDYVRISRLAEIFDTYLNTEEGKEFTESIIPTAQAWEETIEHVKNVFMEIDHAALLKSILEVQPTAAFSVLVTAFLNFLHLDTEGPRQQQYLALEAFFNADPDSTQIILPANCRVTSESAQMMIYSSTAALFCAMVQLIEQPEATPPVTDFLGAHQQPSLEERFVQHVLQSEATAKALEDRIMSTLTNALNNFAATLNQAPPLQQLPRGTPPVDTGNYDAPRRQAAGNYPHTILSSHLPSRGSKVQHPDHVDEDDTSASSDFDTVTTTSFASAADNHSDKYDASEAAVKELFLQQSLSFPTNETIPFESFTNQLNNNQAVIVMLSTGAQMSIKRDKEKLSPNSMTIEMKYGPPRHRDGKTASNRDYIYHLWPTNVEELQHFATCQLKLLASERKINHPASKAHDALFSNAINEFWPAIMDHVRSFSPSHQFKITNYAHLWRFIYTLWNNALLTNNPIALGSDSISKTWQSYYSSYTAIPTKLDFMMHLKFTGVHCLSCKALGYPSNFCHSTPCMAARKLKPVTNNQKKGPSGRDSREFNEKYYAHLALIGKSATEFSKDQFATIKGAPDRNRGNELATNQTERSAQELYNSLANFVNRQGDLETGSLKLA